MSERQNAADIYARMQETPGTALAILESYANAEWHRGNRAGLDALAAAEAERDGLPVGPLAEIAAERRRQVDVEGWSTEHDDQHRNGEMAAAAACYAAPTPVFHAVQRAGTGYEPYSSYEPLWPWNDAWWKPTKPTTPRRDLIKAGALIVAELERLDRAALGDAPCP